MISTVEYIWLDGSKPTQRMRSKTRLVEVLNLDEVSLKTFPEWSYDGSSTYQSEGNNSDLLLKPVNFVNDPIRGMGHYLVLCEVFNPDNTPHSTNTRSLLRKAVEKSGDSDTWFGFEQEYTLFSGRTPLGWPEDGFPRPQGPFYCGVGADEVYGREIVEAHTDACIEAGLLIYGTNAEVMPGQWEYQIGYRGFERDDNNAINFCDHQWFARWLLCRIAEDADVIVSFDNKPVKGDWNGAGCHTNFSTKAMRDPKTGMKAIEEAIQLLGTKHEEHVRLYGAGLHERLTGLHETCDITEFRAGVADRGASIRVPHQVQLKGYGYAEDRRPGANSDPYLVASRIITTICDLDESLFTNGKENLSEVLSNKDVKKEELVLA